MEKLRFPTLLLGLFALTVQAETIVPTEWAKTFDITFSGYAGEETLTDFPALVRLNTSTIANFSYDDFLAKDANGVPADLRFTDAIGTVLDYEIDTWNAEGESLVWVRVPTLTKTTKISAYYGRINATAQVNESTVWKDYIGVWHLNGNLDDATPHKLNGEQKGWSATDAARLGKAYAGARKDGYGIQTPNFDSVKAKDAKILTLSGWFCPSASGASEKDARFFCRKTAYGNANGLDVAYKDDKLWVRGANTGTSVGPTGTAGWVYDYAMTAGEWTHLTVVINDMDVHVFYNGVEQEAIQSAGFQPITANGRQLAFANYARGDTALSNFKGRAYFGGTIDETRAYDGALSADRATAEYATMAPDSTFASYGAADAPVTDVIVVVTGVAGEATQTGFTAAGTVFSLGGQASVAVEVEYGVDEDHLTRAPLATATEPGRVQTAVTGLLPNTTYLWRVRAGEVTGDFAEVTTLPGEATFGAVTIESGMIDVTASVSLTRLAASEAGTLVELYVSTDPENWGEAKEVFPAVTTLDAATFTATASGLELGTEYAVAFKATGTYQGETYVTWTEPVTVTTGSRPTIEDRGAVASLVKNTIDFTATLGLTGGRATVLLLTGPSAESLAVTKTWENLAASTELTESIELPAVGPVCYQFVATSSYVPAGATDPTELRAETAVGLAGRVTWTGATDPATDAWRDLDNWDVKILPTTSRAYIAQLPETTGDEVVTRMLYSSKTENVSTLGGLVIGRGQKTVFNHQNWNGNVGVHVDSVRNTGTLEIRNGATKDANQIVFYDKDTEGVINAEGATIRVIAPTMNVRGHRAVYRLNAGIQNDGVISIEHGDPDTTQGGNNEAFSRLQVVSRSGTITNNGTIRLYSQCNLSVTGYAHLQFGDSADDNETPKDQTYTFDGEGRLFLDTSGRVNVGEGNVFLKPCFISNSNSRRHKIVNAARHTIEGAGYIQDLAFDNYGLVRAFDIVRPAAEEGGEAFRYPLQFRCYYNSSGGQFGARIENYPSGRMIAMETSGGLLIGNAEHRSTFFNHGLLEARTGSKIEFRVGTTESVAKEGGDTTDIVGLGGVIAGDGTIETHRPVVFKSAYELLSGPYPAAIVRPGNLALNEDGEDDGLGASLPGILRFTTNVTFKAGTTLEIDGGRVAGGKKVDGIEVAGGVTIEEGAKLKIMTKMPGGTFPLIKSTQPIEGAFTVELAEGASKVRLSSRVDNDTYYLDGTFSEGFAVIVR